MILKTPIDRKAVVERHNIIQNALDSLSPLTVGNGEFAFTADITGLQTFPERYSNPPLICQAQWAWHSFPNPDGYRLEHTFEDYSFHGRSFKFPTIGWPDRMENEAFKWLDANPHRFNLGNIGFYLTDQQGTRIGPDDLNSIEQKLNLWTGSIESYYELNGTSVTVQTMVHPTLDLVEVDVVSQLIHTGQLTVEMRFPYVRSAWGDPSNWESPDKHTTRISKNSDKNLIFERRLDETTYHVALNADHHFSCENPSEHQYIIRPEPGLNRFTFRAFFSKQEISEKLPEHQAVENETHKYWQFFWQDGGVIDLSDSLDSRALELERRIILSQYLMAVQCAGTLPPQETGLTTNSWSGKFHLEMHWWHAAHFPLWNRVNLLERSMGWYIDHLPKARLSAKERGYSGARWPKMVGPEGRETPGRVNPFILWQQPAIIYLAELIYRSRPEQSVLNHYKNMVADTADFLASVLHWDEKDRRYVLGPPVAPAQEIHSPVKTFNPTFELEYFYFGLQVAQMWRERLGMNRNSQWEKVLKNLSILPHKDGCYVAVESSPGIWDDPTQSDNQISSRSSKKQNMDHPSLVGAIGLLPGKRVDRKMMHHTLKTVLKQWDFGFVWGWDFPMMAMCATRLGDPDLALDILMMDNPFNQFQKNGHVPWGRIPCYLPANGGLLTAMAVMTAGWDRSSGQAPGFPDNGQWTVKWEGISPLP